MSIKCINFSDQDFCGDSETDTPENAALLAGVPLTGRRPLVRAGPERRVRQEMRIGVAEVNGRVDESGIAGGRIAAAAFTRTQLARLDQRFGSVRFDSSQASGLSYLRSGAPLRVVGTSPSERRFESGTARMTPATAISRYSRKDSIKLPCGSIKTPAAFPADSRRTLKKHFPPETPATTPAAAGNRRCGDGQVIVSAGMPMIQRRPRP